MLRVFEITYWLRTVPLREARILVYAEGFEQAREMFGKAYPDRVHDIRVIEDTSERPGRRE